MSIKISCYLFLFAPSLFLFSQIKIGENILEVSPYALLELESTERGLLLPRMTNAQRDSAFDKNTPSGVVLFNSETQQIQYSINNENGQVDWQPSKIYTQNTQPKSGRIGDLSYDETTHLLSAWNSQNESWMEIKAAADEVSMNYENGLIMKPNNLVRLGGALIEATSIETSPTNTFSIMGLEETEADDQHNLMITEVNTGILKRLPFSSLYQEYITAFQAEEGQKQFSFDEPIGSNQKLRVYRNGILVNYTLINPQTIELELQATCHQNDEIKIIQFN